MTQQPMSSVPTWTLGDRLGKALHHAGVSVAEMAEYLGVSRNTVGNYVNDRTHIPRPTLMVWSLRTGVPIEWLEHGRDGGTDPGPGTPATTRKADSLAELTRSKRMRARHAGIGDTREYLTAA